VQFLKLVEIWNIAVFAILQIWPKTEIGLHFGRICTNGWFLAGAGIWYSPIENAILEAWKTKQFGISWPWKVMEDGMWIVVVYIVDIQDWISREWDTIDTAIYRADVSATQLNEINNHIYLKFPVQQFTCLRDGTISLPVSTTNIFCCMFEVGIRL